MCTEKSAQETGRQAGRHSGRCVSTSFSGEWVRRWRRLYGCYDAAVCVATQVWRRPFHFVALQPKTAAVRPAKCGSPRFRFSHSHRRTHLRTIPARYRNIRNFNVFCFHYSSTRAHIILSVVTRVLQVPNGLCWVWCWQWGSVKAQEATHCIAQIYRLLKQLLYARIISYVCDVAYIHFDMIDLQTEASVPYCNWSRF